MADAQVKFFFLVAGYDYEGFDDKTTRRRLTKGSKNGLAFGEMCTGRVEERIVAINKRLGQTDSLVSTDATLRFLRFSVETGKIEVIDRAFVGGRGIKQVNVAERDWKPLGSIGTGDKSDPATFVNKGPFRAIDGAADYENLDKQHPNFKHDATTSDIMSIVDVYHSVRGAPEGSILELSVFSHAFIAGPILVNSSNRSTDPKLRDPSDKDGRASLDFGVLMGEPFDDAHQMTSISRLFRFMASFDTKGILRIWGCNQDIEISLLEQVRKQLKTGAATDDRFINLEFEAKWLDRYQVVDPIPRLFFPGDASKANFTQTFGEVKKFLRRRLAQSYVFQFTLLSPMLTAFGALPGTGGNDEKSGFRMMKICKMKGDPRLKKLPKLREENWECPDGYAAVFDFYQKQIGVQVDDRGYGIFDVKTVQKLSAEIAAGTH